jgi:predicted MPP superfamily phosphohydrolase
MLDPQTLPLPRLPAALAGLRIAHLTDLHLHLEEAEPGRLRPRFRAMLDDLHTEHVRRPVDLVVLTGDFMNHREDEPAALRFLAELTRRLIPAVATLGVLGNHDAESLADRLRHDPDHAVPDMYWLADEARRLMVRGTPIDVLGLHTTQAKWPDAVRLVRSMHADLPSGEMPEVHGPEDPARPFRLMLSHFPRVLPTAADLGVDLLLAGHTHGGQICLPGRKPLKNSSSLPNRLTAGHQRHGHTLMCVSRGLGEMTLPLRTFAPRQLPIYTLTQGPLPRLKETRSQCAVTELVRHW